MYAEHQKSCPHFKNGTFHCRFLEILVAVFCPLNLRLLAQEAGCPVIGDLGSGGDRVTRAGLVMYNTGVRMTGGALFSFSGSADSSFTGILFLLFFSSALRALRGLPHAGLVWFRKPS